MAILPKLMPWLYSLKCWSCYKALRRGTAVMGSSPFGAPFTYDQCRTCSDRRAVDEHHMIWTLRRWGMGAFPPPPEQLEQEFVWAEADGDPTTARSAIHVASEGRYVPVRQWVGTPAHERAIARYVDHPAHRHLNLDPHVRNEDRKAA